MAQVVLVAVVRTAWRLVVVCCFGETVELGLVLKALELPGGLSQIRSDMPLLGSVAIGSFLATLSVHVQIRGCYGVPLNI